MSPLIERAQYRNDSGQIIGVTTIDRKGDDHGRALLPGETIWLSEDERRATARAPRDPEDNPFAKGWLTRVVESRLTDSDDRPIDSPHAEPAPPPTPPQEATGGIEAAEGLVERPPKPERAVEPAEAAPKRERVPAGVVAGGEAGEEEHAALDHREETGAAPQPQGKPVEGEYAAAEEVGDPESAKLGGRDSAREIKGTDAIRTPAPRGERPSTEA